MSGIHPIARWLRSAGATTLVACTTLLIASSALATPHPEPEDAGQLACNLSPDANPIEYRGWWREVEHAPEYRRWFWEEIVPGRLSGSCAATVERLFWERAVPENWAWTGAMEGWYQPDGGGYYTQTLWLKAVPDNWVRVDDLGGWYLPRGGYYTQTFWSRAVPENWGPVVGALGDETHQGYYRYWFWRGAVAKNWVERSWKLGSVDGLGYYRFFLWGHAVPGGWADQPAFAGWRDPSGGYYEQSLWLHAVPQNWLAYDGETFSLGQDLYGVDGDDQGHYRRYFWEYAVPENWSMRSDFVDGWPWHQGGYYTQLFWWRAVPEDWLPTPAQAIGGIGNQGHYAFWLFHYAAPRGFALRPDWSVRGSAEAGYYLFHMHETLPSAHAEYRELKRLTSAHLAGAHTPAPVDQWFDEGARAVVVLSFDTEGRASESCRLDAFLDEQEIDATFLLNGAATSQLYGDPAWRACLASHDLGNHTLSHVDASGYGEIDPAAGRALLDMTESAFQRREVELVQSSMQTLFSRTAGSFRTPLCDGHRSFDGSIVDTLEWLRGRPSGSGPDGELRVDSSVATITRFARSLPDRLLPPSHLADLSVQTFPYPYEIREGDQSILEIPFTYPSDWTGYNGDIVDARLGRAPNGTTLEYLSNIWKRSLDEIHAQRGVMVLVLHPWVIGYSDANVDGLRDFVEYAKSLNGVRFSTLSEVADRFRDRP